MLQYERKKALKIKYFPILSLKAHAILKGYEKINAHNKR